MAGREKREGRSEVELNGVRSRIWHIHSPFRVSPSWLASPDHSPSVEMLVVVVVWRNHAAKNTRVVVFSLVVFIKF